MDSDAYGTIYKVLEKVGDSIAVMFGVLSVLALFGIWKVIELIVKLLQKIF